MKVEEFKDPKLTKIVEILKKEFGPKRLFLFGSRASGTARDDSDYDFVVVVEETSKNRFENMGLANQALRSAGISAAVEAFVYDQSEFDEWKSELSSIPETAVNTGAEIDLE